MNKNSFFWRKNIWDFLNDLTDKTIIHPQYFAKAAEYKCLNEVRKLIYGTFLDIGCGRQQYRKMLEEKAKRYLALDHPILSLNYESLHPVELKADVINIPLPDKTIDTALMLKVLEFLPDPGKALQEIKRIMKPKGKLIIFSVENYPSHGLPLNYYHFTINSLKEISERNGFKLKSVNSFGNFWETQVTFQNVYLMQKIKRLTTYKKSFLLGVLLLLLCAPIIILSNIIVTILSDGKTGDDFAQAHMVVLQA